MQFVTSGSEIEVSTLIVGGGGAGLTASALLSQAGVETLLVNTRTQTSNVPRAHVLNQRTMEILRDLGLADEVYERGTPAENMTHAGWYAGLGGPPDEAGRRCGRIEIWGAGNTNPSWSAASACRQANLPQSRFEPLLRRRAEELAPGRVRFGHTVTEFVQDHSGVTATVSDETTGETYRVRADYLLGCDGGRLVGPSVGIDMEGMTGLARMVTVHLSADLSGSLPDPEVLIRWLWLPEVGFGAGLVPMGPDRWGNESEEWMLHVNDVGTEDEPFDDDAVLAHARAALGLSEQDMLVHRINRWELDAVVAERFRDGRVFLLGDAAHRFPPTGGLGLNSAIQDAHNLAWKIAAVHAGYADEKLLDSYEDERKTVAVQNIQQSANNAMRHVETVECVGMERDGDPVENRRKMRRVWDEAADGADAGADLRRAIAAHSMEFDALNVEYGFSYDSDAVVRDGTPQPHNPDPIRIYLPGTRAGQPLPHAWLEDIDGHRLPIMDLVRPGRFLLIAGESDQVWRKAAVGVAADLDVPLDVVSIGHVDGDYRDPRSAWITHRGICSDGAVLVRPDRHVAWRSRDAADNPVTSLREALSSVLGRAG